MTGSANDKIVSLVLVDTTEEDPGPKPGALAMPKPNPPSDEEDKEATCWEWKIAA